MTGALPQIDLDFESDLGLLWVILKPEPKPVFTLTVIESVLKVQRAIVALYPSDGPVKFVASRAAGDNFSLGGDLDFYLDCLRTGDREGLASYARGAAEVIWQGRTGISGRVITLAMVRGRALGGGIDPARAHHVLVAERGASFCYPEINYNHFPITAVPVLTRHVSPRAAQDILTSGATYTAEDFERLGLVDQVAADGGGEEAVRATVRSLQSSRRARLGVLAAIERAAPPLREQLDRCVEDWVEHFASLGPADVARLQRIAQAQERMLARLTRAEPRPFPLDRGLALQPCAAAPA